MFSDRRVERYWQLIGAIKGLPASPSLMSAYDLMSAYEWFLPAIRAA